MKNGAVPGRLSASVRDGGRSWCMKDMADTNAWDKTEKAEPPENGSAHTAPYPLVQTESKLTGNEC